MRESDGVGLTRAGGSVIRNPTSSNYTFQGLRLPPNTKRRNRRNQQQNEEDKNEVEKTFTCQVPGCDRAFSSKFKLGRHELTHSGERRFQCNSCGKRFHRKDHLKNHLQVHNPNKILHACNLCQKTYCSLLSYRKHIALHAAESGDLVCKLCGKMLDNREGILQHLKVHTGSRTLRGPSERKFPCERCDRSFFTKKDVKRHLVVHTGKRDFGCPHCPQRFGRKDHLVRHAKKSHSSATNGNSSSTEALHNKYKAQSTDNMRFLNENTRHNNIIAPSTLPDVSRLVMSPPMEPMPMMDQPGIELKQEYNATPPPPSNGLIQPNFVVAHVPNENGQNLGRYTETALLPMSQYAPMNPGYPTATQIMSHHYINMPTSNSMLSELLPPMTAASSFPTPVSLDMGNPALPHFNQAFQ